MAKPLSGAELTELAAGLRRLLDAIASGELTASSGAVARLEGAWIAIEALARAEIIDIGELLDSRDNSSD